MNKYQAIVDITLRKSILDVQGKAVEQALHSIEFPMITNVRIGKHVELFVEADSPEKAREFVDDASKKLIANPIIEDYEITINEVK
jgi:phosphoribosylformylglycinamidine synthase subunit PurS